MAESILDARLKESKIDRSQGFLEKIQKCLAFVIPLWIIIIGVQEEITYSNTIYSISILIGMGLIGFTKFNKKLSYFFSIVLVIIMDLCNIDLAFRRFPEYSGIFIASSTQLLFHGILDLCYTEIHGYISIALNSAVWIFVGIYSGRVPSNSPFMVDYCLIVVIILRGYCFRYRLKMEKDYLHNRIVLENKESNMQSLLRVIPEGILVLNYKLNIEMKNLAFEALIEKGEYAHLKYLDHHHNDIFSKSNSFQEDMSAFIDSPEINVTFGLVEASGKKIECTGSKVLWNNKEALALTFRNVTGLINLERENTQKSETLETIRGVSHELKNSINIIVNKHLQVLNEDETLSPATRNCINTSLSSCKLLLFTLRDILDYSNIKSKNFALIISPFNIKQALEECIKLVQYVLNYTHLDVYFDENIPRVIETDKSRVQQVIISILSSCIG